MYNYLVGATRFQRYEILKFTLGNTTLPTQPQALK
jgi:hypothetical protein